MQKMLKKLGIFCVLMIVMSLGALATPVITTLDATNVDETTVTLNGQLSNLTGGWTSAAVYFYYKASTDSTYTRSANQTLTSNTTYTVDLTSLPRDTTYTYYAALSNGTLGNQEVNSSTIITYTTLKTLRERNVISGVESTQTIIYTAIALIALMILVGAAVFIYTMFNGSMDPEGLMQIAAWGIGGAIALLAGTIIIGLVAQAIIG